MRVLFVVGFLFFECIPYCLGGMAAERKYDWSIPTFELAFDLPGGKIDCFYEMIKAGGKFKFTFRVMNPATPLRGNYITAYIRDPKNNLVIRFLKQRQTNMPMFTAEQEGYYQFCFDNTADRFASKKIEAFIAVVVPDDPFEAQALVAEELKSNETVETYNILKQQVLQVHFTTSQISNQLHMKRRLENADLADLIYYQKSITRYSLLTSVLIFVVAYFHTWFIKRMFESSTKVPMQTKA